MAINRGAHESKARHLKNWWQKSKIHTITQQCPEMDMSKKSNKKSFDNKFLENKL